MPSGQSQREAALLSTAHVQLIADTVPDQYSALVQFLAGTGARWAEATALETRDIDLTGDRGVVAITKAWKRDRGEGVLDAPKTRRGRRSVTMGERLTNLMREHLVEHEPDELVFQHPAGRQLTNYWFFAHVWRPTVEDLGGQPPAQPRVHDLRHTHASWLIQQGVALPVIQRRLGHESIATTVNVYGHLADDADRLAADALDW
ncbi:site-specific integrase [Kocuria flava]|uniref:site-specific integrase n=1 Tax=Kocuria flava TaxID=446860 RepID=UPI001FF43ABF|nr:site-specific integrase [Kocuria flava]MCJ8505781.1 site-specific integrase [Kocuria flava]